MTENEVTTVEEGAASSSAESETETKTETVVEYYRVIDVVDLDRPFMTTDFNDYTVSEGLLLILVIMVFLKWCAKMLKGGFSWLWW